MRAALAVLVSLVPVAARAQNIGDPCTPSASDPTGGTCTAAVCVPLDASLRIGACAVQVCTKDDPVTRGVDEDTCVSRFGPAYICIEQDGVNDTDDSDNVCVRRCTPSDRDNPCAPGIACSPALNFGRSLAPASACVTPACRDGRDCAVNTATACDPAGSGAECDVTHAEFCRAASAGGMCARPGTCDSTTGLCSAVNLDGAPGARIGDPCESSVDCAPGAVCQPKTPSGAVRNGYCTIGGCLYADHVSWTACPAGSACNRYFSAGLCQRSCALDDPVGCRGVPADLYADYECYAWNNLSFLDAGGRRVLPLADTPVCDWQSTPTSLGLSCAAFAARGITCGALGIPDTNATHMECRDPMTGMMTRDPAAAGGRCLDDTSSDRVARTDAGIGAGSGAADAGPRADAGPGAAADGTAGADGGSGGGGGGGCGCSLSAAGATGAPWVALAALALLGFRRRD